MKIVTYSNAHPILVAPIALRLMRYLNSLKSALFLDRRFAEAQARRIGLPLNFLPVAGYTQMTVMIGLGSLSLSRPGDKDAQAREFCL